MKECLYCQSTIDDTKKFCNNSCSASFNNRGKQRNITNGNRILKNCFFCGNKTTNKKFCSRKCNSLQDWKDYCDLVNSLGKLPEILGVYGYNPKLAKRFLIETRGRKCEICQLENWQDKPIPLVLDHISGDSSDHQLSNLRLVCGNCNMLLPTFAGKNIGKGRSRRKNLKRI